jgi:BssS protein family
MTDEIPLFPVATIGIGPLPSLGLIAIRPDFLTHASQAIDQATHGRTYVLTPVQAHDVARQILLALKTLQSAGSPSEDNPKH